VVRSDQTADGMSGRSKRLDRDHPERTEGDTVGAVGTPRGGPSAANRPGPTPEQTNAVLLAWAQAAA
jgi:hypothetical protein